MAAPSVDQVVADELEFEDFVGRAEGVVSRAFAEGLLPPERLTVSEWADRYRMLSSKASAERGRYRTDRAPFLRDVADALSPKDPVKLVSVMKGAQLGFTELLVNVVGFVIHHEPSAMLFVEPTVPLARRLANQRIDPAIEETPELAELVAEKRSRDGGNTTLEKQFPGGFLILTGANSAVGLRSSPARYVLLDECDAYPHDADGEGEPTKLAERAARTYPNRKVARVSTPKTKHSSRIEDAYDRSSKGRFFVPCPECGAMQTLEFPNLKWETEDLDDKTRRVIPESVGYACESCGVLFPEHHKTKMLAAGEWRHERPELYNEHRGFHLSALYSPLGWRSWLEIAQDWVDSANDQEKRRIAINIDLGETWEERGAAPEWEQLYARRESYELRVAPARSVFVTAGVDVQRDRFECELVAWAEGRESWSIDYHVIPGDTSSAKTWTELRKYLEQTIPHEGGVDIPIRMAAVDAGDNTGEVLSWTRKQDRQRVMAVMGRDSQRTAIVSQPTQVDINYRGRRIRRGAMVWYVGVSLAKSELYGWLRLLPPTDPEEDYPPGFVHFPQYPPQWFKQLTAEHLVTKTVRGRPVSRWEVKSGQRNEALDCRNYARAAAEVVGLSRWSESRWERERNELGAEKTPRRRPVRRRRRKGYLD